MITTGQIILSFPLAASAVQCLKMLEKRGEKIKISHSKIAKYTFAGVLVSFFFLIYKFVTSDFMYFLVFLNSHTKKPLIYKISGVWGNHEGSMLLFLLILTGYSYLFSRMSDFRFKQDVLGYQGLVTFLLLFYVFFTSNPFEPIPGLLAAPKEGMGLNPLLQDIGLAIHPPVLYLGFAGFSLAFSIALTVLKNNVTEKNWCEYSRPWILLSFIFLSLGVGLGAWWAYHELGWGGFWFWDPVENTSLLPWLFATALIHSMYCTKKFNRFAMMTIFLSLVTFMCCLLGFFLVRSGMLSSVHTFASDPTRGTVMLGIIFIIFSMAMINFGKKYTQMKFAPEDNISYISREAAILVQIVLLLAMAFTILLGIFYPMILELFAGKKISVGEPYFNSVFVPIALVMGFFMIFIPVMKWQKERFLTVIKKSALSFILAACFTMYVELHATERITFIIYTGLLVSSWIIILAIDTVARKLIIRDKISKSFMGMVISHASFGMLMLAITLNAVFSEDTQLLMKQKEKMEFAHHSFELTSSEVIKGRNFLAQKADFMIDGKTTLFPENRIYFPDLTRTYEADIDYGIFRDIYLVMGQSEAAKQKVKGKDQKEEYLFPTRIYIKPFMFFLWFSVFCMAFGGFLALVPKKK